MPESHPVQLIVLLVDKRPAAHLDAVHAAALASVLSYAEQVINGQPASELWELWVKGNVERTVRRADQRTFEKLSERYASTDHTEVRVGRARALAFTPVSRGSMARHLSRLETAGTKLPGHSMETASRLRAGSPTVVLNAELAMSTGEACVQAARALFAWFLTLDPEDRLAWYVPGCQFRIVDAVPRAFSSLLPLAAEGTHIRSSRNPKTFTAFVVPGGARAGGPPAFSA